MFSAASRMNSSVCDSVTPASSADWELACITGPSATGSENGTPTSMTSAPAAATPRMSSTKEPGVGYPAVRYTTRARRPSPAMAAKWLVMRSDEVVADTDSVFLGISRFHDGTHVATVRIPCGQINEFTGEQKVSVGIADNAHHWPGNLLHIRIR